MALLVPGGVLGKIPYGLYSVLLVMHPRTHFLLPSLSDLYSVA